MLLSCILNLENEISNHNHNALQNSNKTSNKDSKFFNCRSKANCPVNKEFLTKRVIYKATVSYKKKIYIRPAGRQFKYIVYEYTQSLEAKYKIR